MIFFDDPDDVGKVLDKRSEVSRTTQTEITPSADTVDEGQTPQKERDTSGGRAAPTIKGRRSRSVSP